MQATGRHRVEAVASALAARTAELEAQVRRAEDANADLRAALDRSATAVFLLDGEGRMRHANRRGEDLLAEDGFGLRLSQGRLSLAGRSDAERLSGLIDAAQEPPGAGRADGAMAFASPRRRAPVSLTVAPLRSARARGAGEPAREPCRVIVRLTDPAQGPRLSRDQLQHLFAFTQAEARIALMLLEGLAPAAVADRLGVRLQTVRNQMRALFDKAGVTRQVDLVRMLVAVAG